MTKDDFHACASVQDNTQKSAGSATTGQGVAPRPPAPRAPAPPGPRPPMPRGAMLGSMIAVTPRGLQVMPVATSIRALPTVVSTSSQTVAQVAEGGQDEE